MSGCASSLTDPVLTLEPGDFLFQFLAATRDMVDGGGDLGRGVVRHDVLAAVAVPGFEREHDRAPRLGLVGRVDQPLHQLDIALDRPRAAPQLHALLGGEVGDEDVRAVVLLEMTERDVLPVAGEIGEGQRLRADGLEESRRAAAMLDIGPSVGARGRQEEGVDDCEEGAQIVGDLPCPLAVLECRPRSEARLLRLDRGREPPVFGSAHGYSSFLPIWPATSWMTCQATRPERAPAVTGHSPPC